jgi:tetratricopeptide (TPR) repeat protein
MVSSVAPSFNAISAITVMNLCKLHACATAGKIEDKATARRRQTFDRSEKERGHDQLCKDILNDFAGMVGRSTHIELENLETKVHELLDAGNFEEAVRTARTLEEDARRLVGSEHIAYANALKGLSVALMESGLYQEAVSSNQKLLLLEEKLFGKDSNEVAESLHNLAETLNRLGQHEQAEPLLLPRSADQSPRLVLR